MLKKFLYIIIYIILMYNVLYAKNNNSDTVLLFSNKNIYSKNDTIVITLKNNSNNDIYIYYDNPTYLWGNIAVLEKKNLKNEWENIELPVILTKIPRRILNSKSSQNYYLLNPIFYSGEYRVRLYYKLLANKSKSIELISNIFSVKWTEKEEISQIEKYINWLVPSGGKVNGIALKMLPQFGEKAGDMILQYIFIKPEKYFKNISVSQNKWLPGTQVNAAYVFSEMKYKKALPVLYKLRKITSNNNLKKVLTKVIKILEKNDG